MEGGGGGGGERNKEANSNYIQYLMTKDKRCVRGFRIMIGTSSLLRGLV